MWRRLSIGAPAISAKSSMLTRCSLKASKPERTGGASAQPLEDPSRQRLDPGRLDHMGGRRVTGEPVAVEETDSRASPGEQRRQRRAGAAGADDDHVELGRRRALHRLRRPPLATSQARFAPTNGASAM